MCVGCRKDRRKVGLERRDGTFCRREEMKMLSDMEELPRGDWWICPPSFRHTINHLFHFEMPMA